MRELLSRKPELTLAELREAVALDCTLPAIHYVLADMGLSYKKRHCAPASRGVPTSRGRGGTGGGGSPASTRRGSSSSMKARPRRT
jgi:transposase